MDPFDFPLAPPAPRASGPKLPAAIVTFGLPLVYLALLTVTELSKHPQLAVIHGPLAVGALGGVVGLLTRMRPLAALLAATACVWWCLVAGVTLVAIDILIFPF